MGDIVKLSVKITKQNAEYLKAIATLRGINLTDSLHRALSMAFYFDEIYSKGGEVFVIKKPGDKEKGIRW